MNYKEFNASLDAFIFKFRNAANTPTKEAVEKGIELVRNDPEGFAKHFSQIFVARPRIETLYRDNVEMLRGAACDQYPAISTYDQDASLSSLHANLWEYRGPASSAAFLKWATAWIKRQAARLEAFHRLQSEHSKVVYDGVWDVLNANRDLLFSDLTITVQQIMSTVWVRVWEAIDSLMAPDQPAKVSTRLWDFGNWGGRAWKTDQLRLRSVQKDKFDADHKPERALRPSLAAIEAVPAPKHPEPDFWVKELAPVETAEPEVSNVPAPKPDITAPCSVQSAEV